MTEPKPAFYCNNAGHAHTTTTEQNACDTTAVRAKMEAERRRNEQAARKKKQ